VSRHLRRVACTERFGDRRIPAVQTTTTELSPKTRRLQVRQTVYLGLTQPATERSFGATTLLTQRLPGPLAKTGNRCRVSYGWLTIPTYSSTVALPPFRRRLTAHRYAWRHVRTAQHAAHTHCLQHIPTATPHTTARTPLPARSHTYPGWSFHPPTPLHHAAHLLPSHHYPTAAAYHRYPVHTHACKRAFPPPRQLRLRLLPPFAA